MSLVTEKKYLRTIYQLSLQKKKIRQIDLALSLGYARSSISIMVKHLIKEDLIVIEDSFIFLTVKGMKIAKESLQVHQKAYGWLMNQGFLAFEASEYATKMADNFDERFIKMLIEKNNTILSY